jgi:plastocyanin
MRQQGSMLPNLGSLVALAAIAACGGGETGPNQPATIAKTATNSGDLQIGLVKAPLLGDLRVVVTRDGQPVADEVVTWTTSSGTLSPAGDKTDVEGVSTSSWTLGPNPGPQSATASISGTFGSPVTFNATGVVDNSGPGGPLIQVLGPAAGNRFDPARVQVLVGTTVTWAWANDAIGHNVVPDDGTTPVTSGAVTNGPHLFTYTFNTPGTYHYHCQSHGGSGGVGMSGMVNVVETLP